MRRIPIAFVLVCSIVFLDTTSAEAATVTKGVSATLSGGGTISGMFSGDAGADDLLTSGEFSTWMFSFEGVPGIADTLFEPPNASFTSELEYRVSTNLFESNLQLQASSPVLVMTSLPIAFDFDVGRTMFLHNDGVTVNDLEVVSMTITDKPAGVIPEPATFAVWSILGMCGIGYHCRRRRNAA